MKVARRTVLAAAAFAAAPRTAWAQGFSRGAFTHGVASGDPLADSVILWTRFAHAGEGRIGWEIAHDEGFAHVAARGEAVAAAKNDYCVKIDARGLEAGRPYFYRFLSGSGPSLTGRTRTAPTGGAARMKLALFSCSNYGFGYFHAYGHAALRDDIDLALHCGDYIYELPRGRYPTEREAVPGRIIEPMRETIALHEYYQRYGAYHTDPDLLALRAAKPLCAVWDDHETADNTWAAGARGHNRNEGQFAQRAAAARKAYFDWMPIRAHGDAPAYRALDWGDLARIVLLDTRLAGRDRQIEYRAAHVRRLARGGDDAAAVLAELRAAIGDPARSMLGAAQEDWLTQSLAASKSRGQTWQIVMQQVVMGEQIAAPGLLRLVPESASAQSRAWFAGGAALGAAGMPWNLDSWGGYPAARARLLQTCAAHANNAVILGGDSHNCWLNTLPAPGADRLAAIEFAGGSVTSPGFERPLSAGAAGERETLMRGANPNLAWCDLTHRGYGALTFTRTQCEAEWVAFADVRQRAPAAPHVTRFASEASAGAGPGAWVV